MILDFDPNKALCHDMISKFVVSLFQKLYRKFSNLTSKKDSFLVNGKKQIWFQSIKKGDKQGSRNYRPDS